IFQSHARLSVTSVERLAVTGDLTAGFIRRQAAVHKVITSARESINRLDGTPLLRREEHKGIVEIGEARRGEAKVFHRSAHGGPTMLGAWSPLPAQRENRARK